MIKMSRFCAESVVGPFGVLIKFLSMKLRGVEALLLFTLFL